MVLECSPLPVPPPPDVPAAGAAGAQVWLLLERIHDPMNVGSLLRTAMFFGATRVVLSPGTAPVSVAAARASAGASERIDVHRAPAEFAGLCGVAESRGWDVVGAVPPGAAGAVPMGKGRGRPTMLVLGNEGAGLLPRTAAACTQLACIRGGAAGVDSLNVGVAAGVFLHSLSTRRENT